MKSRPTRYRTIPSWHLIAVCSLLVAVVCGCATGITREELLKKLQAAPAPLVVDVRSQGEYDKDHIPGAVPVPFYSILSGVKKTGLAKKDPVVLYCEHGPRSGIASLTLYLSGYEQIYSLDGHMKGWRANGFPIEVITH
jgi:rhodanese-related sulfurtransferase